jgi:hypothetical protein
MPWLTPDFDENSGTVKITVPLSFVHILHGALLDLVEVYNWEQHGDLTPEQCVDIMLTALDEMVVE